MGFLLAATAHDGVVAATGQEWAGVLALIPAFVVGTWCAVPAVGFVVGLLGVQPAEMTVLFGIGWQRGSAPWRRRRARRTEEGLPLPVPKVSRLGQERLVRGYQTEYRRQLEIFTGQVKYRGTPWEIKPSDVWRMHSSSFVRAYQHARVPRHTVETATEIALFELLCVDLQVSHESVMAWREADAEYEFFLGREGDLWRDLSDAGQVRADRPDYLEAWHRRDAAKERREQLDQVLRTITP